MGAVRILADGSLCAFLECSCGSERALTIKGAGKFESKTVKYQCDANGVKMGLPAGVFGVEYLNETANHLAVVPVKGRPTIFVTVPSGSGAKYAAQEFVWWEAGGGTTFQSGFSGTDASSACKTVQ